MSFWFPIIALLISVGSYRFLDLQVASFVHLAPVDLTILPWIISKVSPPFAPLFLFGNLTFLGWARNWDRQFIYKMLQLFLTCGFILFFLGMLKVCTGRARPELFFTESIYGFFPGVFGNAYRSFPSSHTAIAFGLAWFWRILSTKKIFYPYIIASFIGISRVLLNEHYLTDVWVGGWIGIVVATSIYSLTEKYRWFITKILYRTQ